MPKQKHSEAQIIAALKQVEAGRKVEDLARECGVSKHTIYATFAPITGLWFESMIMPWIEPVEAFTTDCASRIVGAENPRKRRVITVLIPMQMVCAEVILRRG